MNGQTIIQIINIVVLLYWKFVCFFLELELPTETIKVKRKKKKIEKLCNTMDTVLFY